MRGQDEKINILIDLQIKNDERFAVLAESQNALTNTVERIISERGNGKP
jgi:hypothetical protein